MPSPVLLRRPWLSLFVLLAALLVASLVWQQLRGPVVEVIGLQQAALQQHVVASARVATVSRVQVGSEVAGVLSERRVSEGDRVQPGDVLAVIANAEITARANQAKAQLEALQRSQRPQAQAVLTEAQARLVQAEREANRRSELANRQLVSREDAEQARQAVVSARAAVEQARASANAVAAGGAEETAARAAYDAARAALDKTLIRARAAGTVLVRQIEPGDLVQPGTTLFEIASDGPTELRMPVDEKNLQVLAVGQRAQVLADAYPQQPFPATVTYIAPGVDSSRGTVEVRLGVDPVPDFLRQDMTVSVSILTGNREQALVVPNQALRGGAGGLTSVWVVRDGRLATVPVELGLRGTRASEVTAGLQAGDAVLTGDIHGLEPGQRVRTRQMTAPPDDRAG